MKARFASLLKRTSVHVIFAFVAMGSWAFYANIAHPTPTPLIAGMVQGIISAALTLFLKGSVDWMRPRFSYTLGYFMPALIAVCASAALLITAHSVAGTPEITTTIAVPLMVSSLYIFTYNIMRQLGTRQIADD